jgi:transcriptional regulator with XRE-family HTH domain
LWNTKRSIATHGRHMMSEKFEIAIVGKIKHGILYEFLKSKGWNQADLARNLGVTPNDVSNWMRLKKYPKKEEVLRKLMELTGRSHYELFPQFMKEPEWAKIIKEIPREFALARQVDVKQLAGGRKVFALPSAEEEYADIELKERIRHELNNKLTQREAEILRLRFGLFGEEPHTLQKTGKLLGINTERTRQLEGQALRKIKADRGRKSYMEDFLQT